MANLSYLMAMGVSAAIALGNMELCASQDLPSPEYLNPSTNSLIFPTKPEAVQVQRTEPITLQQALNLARRNNPQLQTTVLNLERSRASLREATAAEYPTLNLGAALTREDSASAKLGNQRQSPR